MNDLPANVTLETLIRMLVKYKTDFSKLKGKNISSPRVLLNLLAKEKVEVDQKFYKELARKTGIEFISNRDLVARSYLVSVMPFDVIRKNHVFILEIKTDYILIATSNPFNEKIFEKFEEIFKKEIRFAIASYDAIEIALDFGYKEIHAYQAIAELRDRYPEDSAYSVIYPWQTNFLYLTFLFIGGSIILGKMEVFIWAFGLLNLYYFILNPFKIFIATRGFKHSDRGIFITDEEVNKIDMSTLPVYTILVPVYKEASVLPEIVKHMNNLRYPKDKLDVKILLEENDDETFQAASRLGLIGEPQVVLEGMSLEDYKEHIKFFDVTIVPSADVKTKPRACNYGLYRAKGEYCVIFDAEDEPDPDQLLKAVAAFRKLSNDYVCLQGHLNYFNYNENTLARCFSLEYTFWFDYWLQGLDYIGAPLPLGGTSNHFKTEVLKSLGGWDPYNVTEDADLGIRIVMKKYNTAMLNSWTMEEANLEVGNWIRQRSRWCKGYVQTFLVHTRFPLRLFRRLGLKQTLYFLLTFGGNILMPLVNPLLWIVTIMTIINKDWTQALFTPEITSLALFNLILGNIVYIVIHIVPFIIQKKYSSIPYAFLMPLYWMIMSYAAWKGTLQLIYKPFYWEKTTHGLSTMNRKPNFTEIKNENTSPAFN